MTQPTEPVFLLRLFQANSPEEQFVGENLT